MRQVGLQTPLYEVLGAKSAYLPRLSRLGIKTVRDLLWHFPSRYEDFTKTYKIAELEPGQQATITGTIEDVRMSRSWRRRMSIVEATIEDESGSIRAVWFNQPFMANVLKTGRRANFAGKVSISDEGELYLSHPAHEFSHSSGTQEEDSTVSYDGAGTTENTTSHTARLVPVYPETHGLTSRGIRFLVQSVLKRMPQEHDWIPEETIARLNFPELHRAIKDIHFPRTIEDASAAERRFFFEDLFLLQILNFERKLKLAAVKAPMVPVDLERLKAMSSGLPFPLTPSQKKSLWEILQDMQKERPMNRLLQGDVGSGKTVVAALAALIASSEGFQTAFMAPTEILARQHFETMEKLLSGMPDSIERPAIGLITGSGATIWYDAGLVKPLTKAEAAKRAASGELSIIFGTHSLIEKSVSFKNLALVIVDEQHRFGVRQRSALARKKGGPIPHFLSMSATPIPRTLMLTVFGDLDMSLITELPGGRLPVETKIIPPDGRSAAYKFVRSEISAGRQAFVICPRIEKPEENADAKANSFAQLEMRSVKEEYEKLKKDIFPDLRISMLHGQMKPKEKEAVMRGFKAREYDIIVSTSVVEVGVDVPNATIMMIEGADRFGLAQLYQFRGRVGRGEHKSYCFLMTDSEKSAANARLRAITEAHNGFELAEKDLALRGPGQFFGESQTGLPDITMRALQDPALIKSSREEASAVLNADPLLAKNPALREKIIEFQKEIHEE